MLAAEGVEDEVEEADLFQDTGSKEFQYGGVSKHGIVIFKNNSRAPFKLFIKYCPTADYLVEINKKVKLSIKEAAFFNKILSGMRALWKERTG